MGGVNTLAKGAVIFLSAFAVYTVYPVARDLADSVKPFSDRVVKVHVPSELDGDSRRALTLNLGGGDCLWQVRLFMQPKSRSNHEITYFVLTLWFTLLALFVINF